MSEQKLIISDELRALLLELLEAHRAELVNRNQHILREALFSSRATIRPRVLKTIASDEIDTFAKFLQQTERNAHERGQQLQQTGLSVQPMLGMGQAMRQFMVTHLNDGHIGSALELFDAYQAQLVQGFIQELEQAVFKEQERTRHAFERVVKRDQS